MALSAVVAYQAALMYANNIFERRFEEFTADGLEYTYHIVSADVTESADITVSADGDEAALPDETACPDGGSLPSDRYIADEGLVIGYDPETGSHTVVEVAAGSRAEGLGILAGDIIISVSGSPVVGSQPVVLGSTGVLELSRGSETLSIKLDQ